ncbi:exodeoxyribonuclease VII small subunit [Bacillus lumedeiriae]|uniref:exodeoxyribonuclease VII small subunit n=1 Tax=Bacillus lumedeiriae TaxID=3058829 RepID=UPI00384EE79D
MESKEVTFEEAMDKLELIITKLEEGDVPLEKALRLYQEGIGLSAFCHSLLSQAEDQLAKIMTDDGEKEFVIDEGE